MMGCVFLETQRLVLFPYIFGPQVLVFVLLGDLLNKIIYSLGTQV